LIVIKFVILLSHYLFLHNHDCMNSCIGYIMRAMVLNLRASTVFTRALSRPRPPSRPKSTAPRRHRLFMVGAPPMPCWCF